jgi:hypothetical protein
MIFRRAAQGFIERRSASGLVELTASTKSLPDASAARGREMFRVRQSELVPHELAELAAPVFS